LSSKWKRKVGSIVVLWSSIMERIMCQYTYANEITLTITNIIKDDRK